MRKFSAKNIGWLVSSILYYGVSIPYVIVFAYNIINDVVFTNVPWLTVAVISLVWYQLRNAQYGYGISYFRQWYWDREDAIWQKEMRAKRERLYIQHHKYEDTEYDTIAK